MKAHDVPVDGEVGRSFEVLVRDVAKIAQIGKLSTTIHPVVNLSSMLMRSVRFAPVWEHPELGVVHSSELWAAARASSCSSSLAYQVCEMAMGDFKRIRSSLPVDTKISISVSTDLFDYEGLKDGLLAAVSCNRLSPSQVVLSFSETESGAELALQSIVAKELRSHGFQYALENLGQGAASLRILKECAFSRVLIAPNWIKNIATSVEDFQFVSALVAMAKSLNIEVIASGVCSSAQAGVLSRIGCHAATGDHFGKHLTVDSFSTWYEYFKPLTQAASREEKIKSGKLSLLVVDDEPNVLSALKRLLRKDDYEIYCATSAREAFEILATNGVDVIISDQRMPDLNGSDFLSQVKEMYPQTVRMMLSGYTELDSVTEAINKGAIYKFLTKPWVDDQLRANVREAFHRHYMEQQNVQLKKQVESINAELVQLNHMLEQRVSDRNQRIERDQGFRQVMQEILDKVAVGVIGIDPHGEVVMVNDQAGKLLGADRGHLLGKGLYCMPPTLATSIDGLLWSEGSESREGKFDFAGIQMHYRVQTMGSSSDSSGCLVCLSDTEF